MFDECSFVFVRVWCVFLVVCFLGFVFGCVACCVVYVRARVCLWMCVSFWFCLCVYMFFMCVFIFGVCQCISLCVCVVCVFFCV